MTKSCEDMEDIIRILIDMFDNMNVDFNTVMIKVRDKHYCLFCMQHYRRCKCDFANVAISSDSEDNSLHSTEDEDYTSSESDNGTNSESESGTESDSGSRSSGNKSHSDFSESCSESESEKSEIHSNSESESESEDDKIINKIISNSTLKKVVLDDPATTSESEEEL